jgi:hypothetical protein
MSEELTTVTAAVAPPRLEFGLTGNQTLTPIACPFINIRKICKGAHPCGLNPTGFMLRK